MAEDTGIPSKSSDPEALPTEDEEQSYFMKERFIMFFANHFRGLICLITPLVCLPIIFPTYEKYQWVAYALVIMAVFWVSECIPLPITSFIPMVIFPLTGVMDSEKTAKCYLNDTIVMFLGSLMLAASIEQSGLHKRMAYCAIRAIGYSHYKLLFALCFITMFISMWITNTAATTMMVPIVFAVLNVLEEQKILTLYDKTEDGDLVASDITTCYFCSVTYSATIGGIGTLVGTGTNLVFKGFMERGYPTAPDYLSFPLFSAFAVPYMILMELFCYLGMVTLYLGFMRPKSKTAQAAIIPPKGVEAAKAAVLKGAKELGPFSYWEAMVAILFGGGMFMFFARSPKMFPGWGDLITSHLMIKDPKFIKDASLAMAVAFAMLLLPRNLKIFKNFTAKFYEDLPKGRIPSVLDWPIMNAQLSYSFMFLLGGGFALSTAAEKDNSDLNGRIGDFLAKLEGMPELCIIFIIIAFTIFVTNFASNVAVANVIVPIAMTLAVKLNKHPLQYNIACGYSASYCFMLPVGTPGNLIVQTAAKIPTKKMIVAGVMPTISTLIISWLAMCFWAPVVWPDLRNPSLPDWAIKPEVPTP